MLSIDRPLMLWFNRHDYDWLTRAMWFVSRLGTVTGWLLLTLVYLAIRRDTTATLIMLVVSGLGVTVSVLLKVIIKRPRPWITIPELVERRRRPYDPSFPSGHTFSAFAIAGTMAILDPPTAELFMAFATLIGLSRIYLLVHHVTDVIAGAILGIALARGFLWLITGLGLLNLH